MKNLLCQLQGCFYIVVIFLMFSSRYLVDNYLEWRDWKRSVRREIDAITERVEDADTAP